MLERVETKILAFVRGGELTPLLDYLCGGCADWIAAA
jgi:hypothetical protein